MRLLNIKRTIDCLLLIAALLVVPAYADGEEQVTGPKYITGRRDMVWPVPESHAISSCFLDRRNHCAIDIGGKAGMEIVAAYDGKVKKVSEEGNGHGFGYYVILQHDYLLANGETIELYTVYSHISKALVEEWQEVKAGEPIAIIGSTGYSTGIHLDFQIHYKGWSLVYFQDYSIDPYINDLLQIPDDVILWDNWPCGEEYLAIITERYSKQIPYIGRCHTTDAQPEELFNITSECVLKTEPRDGAAVLCDPFPIMIKSGTAVKLNSTIINTVGETWYCVTTDNGKTGYIKQ